MNDFKKYWPMAGGRGSGVYCVCVPYRWLVMRHIELYNGSEMSIDWKMFKGAIDFVEGKHNGMDRIRFSWTYNIYGRLLNYKLRCIFSLYMIWYFAKKELCVVGSYGQLWV